MVVSALLLTGCGTMFSETELNAAAPALPRAASSVEVFASTPPTRPHVDVRIIEAIRPALAGVGSAVDELRAEAGRQGCDAIFVNSVVPATPKFPEHASATCIQYTDAAPVAPPPDTAASDGPRVGAVLRAPE